MRHLIYLVFFIASPLWAHPHAWIDVEVTPIVNEKGELTGLYEKWQFDPLFSSMMLEEIIGAKTQAEGAKAWQMLVDDTTTALREEGFYTFPKPSFLPAKEIELSTDDKLHHLFLSFQLPLVTATKTLQYQIYEPEYYVEMLHSTVQRTDFGHCQLTIMTAQPDEEKFIEASALDTTDKGDPNLGRFFAETGEMTCQ